MIWFGNKVWDVQEPVEFCGVEGGKVLCKVGKGIRWFRKDQLKEFQADKGEEEFVEALGKLPCNDGSVRAKDFGIRSLL